MAIIAGFWHAGGGRYRQAERDASITWMMAIGADKDRYEALVAAFHAAHPEIRVRIIWVPGGEYQTKFKTLAAAGTPPDIFMTGDVWVAYLLPFLMDVTDLVERDAAEIDLPDYFPEVLSAIKHRGRFYFLPNTLNISLLYYNKTLFDQAGVSYPTDAWTWDDYVRAGVELTRELSEGDQRIWGADLVSGWWGEWLIYVRQSGGRMFNDDCTQCLLDSPEAIRGMQFYYDLVFRHKMAARPGYGPSTGFSSGTLGMVYGGHTGNWREYNQIPGLDWDIQVLPKGPAGRSGGEIAMGAYGISKDCRDREAAWTFLKFITSKEAVADEVRDGGLPVRRSVANELLFSKGRTDNPRNIGAVLAQIPYCVSIPRSPDYIEIALDIIQPVFDRMMEGQISPEQACREATQAANHFIKTLGVREGRP